jgi:hypothetical protein
MRHDGNNTGKATKRGDFGRDVGFGFSWGEWGYGLSFYHCTALHDTILTYSVPTFSA